MIPCKGVKALYRTIFWDWNGTLLDDVDYVVRLNNRLFSRWGLEPFATADAYREVFDFPIRDYYRRVGVTENIFEDVAQAWSAGYMEGCRACPLREGAAEAVARFREAGLRQVVVSASKGEHLSVQVGFYPQLAGAFDSLLGLADIYAASKVHLAQGYLAAHGLDPAEVVLLGDTCHDHEVAQAVGCGCLLISGGHQLPAKLAATGRPVMGSLGQAVDYILK